MAKRIIASMLVVLGSTQNPVQMEVTVNPVVTVDPALPVAVVDPAPVEVVNPAEVAVVNPTPVENPAPVVAPVDPAPVVAPVNPAPVIQPAEGEPEVVVPVDEKSLIDEKVKGAVPEKTAIDTITETPDESNNAASLKEVPVETEAPENIPATGVKKNTETTDTTTDTTKNDTPTIPDVSQTEEIINSMEIANDMSLTERISQCETSTDTSYCKGLVKLGEALQKCKTAQATKLGVTPVPTDEVKKTINADFATCETTANELKPTPVGFNWTVLCICLAAVVVCILCCTVPFCFPCSPADSDIWKVKLDVNVAAPADWVWKHFPVDFDMSKIMTELDKDGNPVTGGFGIMKQRHGPNFNAPGSHIYYTGKDGSEIDQEVLIRDEASKTYKCRIDMKGWIINHTMTVDAIGQSTCIHWTYHFQPKGCMWRQPTYIWKSKVHGPFLTKHCAVNMKNEIEKKYKEEQVQTIL